jgi:hypothetical protein
MTSELNLGQLCSVVGKGITPRGFESQDDNQVHIDDYVQSFDKVYVGRFDNTLTNCKTGSSRLLDVYHLRKSEESLLCKCCVVKQRDKERKADESALRKIVHDVVSKKMTKHETQARFDRFFNNKNKNNSRQTHQFVKKCEVRFTDNTYGIACDAKYTCGDNCPIVSLSKPSNPKQISNTRGQKTVLDHDLNCDAIMGQFFNGVGPSSVANTALMLDLPHAQHLSKLVTRHQAKIGEKIYEFTTEEMRKAMDLEIKMTLKSTETPEYCENYWALPEDERPPVGLTISYDMGWNKRSSGHRYDSLSGHAFAIGAYTRRIIDFVVFSKRCSICSSRNKLKDSSNSNNETNEATLANSPPTADPSAATGPNGSGISGVPTVVNGRNVSNRAATVVNGSSINDSSATVVSGSGKEALGIDRGNELGVIDVSDADHDCVLNYLGSSGGMESDGLMMLFKKLHKDRNGKLHYDTVVTDDDTKLKQYLSHPWYRPNGKKNHGGELPLEIPQPKWFADPTHRAKCVAGVFFDIIKGPACPIRATKLDALRMKKYYGYYIKQNRAKSLEWLHEHAMAPLDHLFNNHHLCCDSWCFLKQLETKTKDKADNEEPPRSQRLEDGYYRSMTNDLELYNAMKARYMKYISLDFLKMCVHEFDTQLNEGMNTSVASYAQKGITYCTTTSLRTRVLTAAGIQLVGFHRFWSSIFDLVGVPFPKQLSDALIAKDKQKVRKFYREHDNEYKAKRNKTFHDRFRAELISQTKDKKRNKVYSTHTGCESTDNSNRCAHKGHGCGGKQRHKSSVSRLCLYAKMKGAELEATKQSWVAGLRIAIADGSVNELVFKRKEGKQHFLNFQSLIHTKILIKKQNNSVC